MIFRRSFLSMVLFLVAFASCKNNEKGKIGGSSYQFIQQSGKELIKDYDFISLSYKVLDTRGNTISSTYGFDGRPVLRYKVKPYFKGDLNDILSLASEGDSLTFKLSKDSLIKYKLFKNEDVTGDFLVYQLKVNQVITRGNKNDNLLNQAIELLKKQELEKARITEKNKIQNFLLAQKGSFNARENGIYYQVFDKDTIKKKRNEIEVLYQIRSLDGKLFETNIKDLATKEGIYDGRLAYQPYKLDLSKPSKTGFDFTAQHLKNYHKVRAVVPSSLAYGENGNYNIPPFTPLIVEIVKSD